MSLNVIIKLKQSMNQKCFFCSIIAMAIMSFLFISNSQATVNYPAVEAHSLIRYQTPKSSEWHFDKLEKDTPIHFNFRGENYDVGTIHKDSIILSKQTSEGRFIAYGYDTAMLDDEFAYPSQPIHQLTVTPFAQTFSQPKTNELFITTKPISLYTKADINSAVFGTLSENVRYPINANLIDQSGNHWHQIFLAGNIVYVNSKDVEIDKGISVLTFHHILEDTENRLYRGVSTTTSVDAFKNQMAHLKSLGYETITLDELYQFLKKERNLPSKVFVITFDDGLKSVHKYGYPILKDLEYQATVFMITSRIKRHTANWQPDSLQFMSLAEIEEAKSVFNYQSHSHFLHKLHNKKPIIFQRTERVIEYDVERSIRALRQFNPSVYYFAYPFGAFDTKALNAVKAAGIKMAFSTVKGRVKPGDNLLKLKRIYLLSSDSLSIVEDKILN